MKRAVIVIGLIACGGDTALPVAELQNPETCRECHEQHYQQWAGSMHAYASDDPVFVAMNKRGQRETNNALGDFCVRCHAPMAVELGLTTGVDFDPTTLPPEARGVTCYFCHNVAAVEDTHNNGLVIANDQTMRGGLRGAVKNSAHFSKYDPLMDSGANNSEMCGSCHDIVVPQRINGVADVAVEKTFAEWQQTFFASDPDPINILTCGECHMLTASNQLVADAPGLGTFPRPDGFHAHTFPGVDLALTPFPNTEQQTREVQDFLDLSIGIRGARQTASTDFDGGICLQPNGTLAIRIDNLSSGHAWPSGAAFDRRAWLEVKAFDVNGAIVFESGVTPDGTDPLDTPGLVGVATVGLWERAFKGDNTPAHFFWEVVRTDSEMLLPVPFLRDGDHSMTATWNNIPSSGTIDRIETRILMRPMPYEVLDDLIASGDLDPAIRDRLPTIVVGGTVVGTGGTSVWTRATAGTGTAMNTPCNPYPPPL